MTGLTKVGAGGQELIHRTSGKLSSAVMSTWGAAPQYLWLAGLYGCTSVVIIGEAGVWFGHYYESPSFESAERFLDDVIGATRNGDGPDMPTSFGLQGVGKPLAQGTKVQVFISTPKGPTGALLYTGMVGQIKDLLTGTGAPFVNANVTVQGYLKPNPEELADVAQAQKLGQSVRGKVLVEYDNNEKSDASTGFVQKASWRVTFEDDTWDHEWDATVAPKGPPAGTGSSGAPQPASNGPLAGGSSSKPVIDTTPPNPPAAPLPSIPTTTTSSSIAPPPKSTPPATSTPQASPTSSTSAATTKSPPQAPSITPSPKAASTSTIVDPHTMTASNGEVSICDAVPDDGTADPDDRKCVGPKIIISVIASLASAYKLAVAGAGFAS